MENVKNTATARDFTADRAICDAATAGADVWKADGKSVVQFDYDNGEWYPLFYGELDTEDDARFIAEARTGWPAALDRMAELEAENKRLKSEMLSAHIDERVAFSAAETYYNEIQRYRQALESLLSVFNGNYITKNKPSAHVDAAIQKAKEALGDGGV